MAKIDAPKEMSLKPIHPDDIDGRWSHATVTGCVHAEHPIRILTLLEPQPSWAPESRATSNNRSCGAGFYAVELFQERLAREPPARTLKTRDLPILRFVL